MEMILPDSQDFVSLVPIRGIHFVERSSANLKIVPKSLAQANIRNCFSFIDPFFIINCKKKCSRIWIHGNSDDLVRYFVPKITEKLLSRNFTLCYMVASVNVTEDSLSSLFHFAAYLFTARKSSFFAMKKNSISFALHLKQFILRSIFVQSSEIKGWNRSSCGSSVYIISTINNCPKIVYVILLLIIPFNLVEQFLKDSS